METSRRNYQANLNQADFTTGAEAARKEINHWVEQQTRDKIRDILPAGSLTPLTRLVLANAIYFKGQWLKPFEKSATSNQPFHLTSTKQADVPLMHHFDDVRYAEDSDFQAVELPYSHGELAMVILLPRQIEGCGNLENRLNPDMLSGVLGRMRFQEVEISLPRFKLDSGFDLGDALSKLGMSDAFGPKSDFSGIDGTHELYVSGVFHKAWCEVNEQGTEAAAATVVPMPARAAIKSPPVFRADHPFLFLIRDTRSGSLLFLGRLSDPAR
jgi:serpin B